MHATPAREPRAPDEPAFTHALRVYYEDTDAGGVVYYANYLRWFERARTEAIRSLGFGQAELARTHGILFVVAEAHVRYRRPARLDDELLIETSLGPRGGSFVTFLQRARRGADVLCEGECKVACVDAASLRPVRIPSVLDPLFAAAPPTEPEPR